MTEKRIQVSKRMRFEVFKRDSFSCQYCGKSSPDVILHADHIKPVSKGGKNTLLNLITACESCNLGKSDIEIGDDTAIKKQALQLKALSARDEQITMMVSWQESLLKSEEKLVCSAVNEINRLMSDYSLNDNGVMTVRKAIKKNGYESVMGKISQCYQNSSDNDDFRSKWSKAISFKLGDEPKKESIHYVKGILKNRFANFNERKFYADVGSYDFSDEELARIISIAKTCWSISEFYLRKDEVECDGES